VPSTSAASLGRPDGVAPRAPDEYELQHSEHGATALVEPHWMVANRSCSRDRALPSALGRARHVPDPDRPIGRPGRADRWAGHVET
jgi:hypothetical protein